ncbi:MAG: hypothetical protein BRC25_03435 [Parcubacteria group bacterium SW_6_46_9]|nr:MAG: hypothetical protein BRC25_03435 [Parcubacteria group bacterium SW_6_46_9]
MKYHKQVSSVFWIGPFIICSFVVFLAVRLAGALGFTPDMEIASIVEIIAVSAIFLLAIFFSLAYFFLVNKPKVRERMSESEHMCRVVVAACDLCIGLAMFFLSGVLFWVASVFF